MVEAKLNLVTQLGEEESKRQKLEEECLDRTLQQQVAHHETAAIFPEVCFRDFGLEVPRAPEPVARGQASGRARSRTHL